MGIISWLSGDNTDAEYDAKLLEEIVANYQPSMRVVGDIGGWCLVMDPEEGRRTAKIHGEPTRTLGDK